ncbi:CHASE domain-containing protein [Rheinheimera riviphila]|nr:CHASE domain-containing protein [Rheinheimera riviphila]
MPTSLQPIPMPPQSTLSIIAKIALLAIAYMLTGHLAMLLSVPPGFISSIFPPVGVALAAVLIWGYPLLIGVFLGSTLLNLSIAISNEQQLNWQQLTIACSIAFGTTLQCLCANWLIRRKMSFPNTLTEDRNILLLLFIGGPLSCLLSASVGTAVLYVHQIITPGQLLFSWWNWWIGDSIGVLIAMPLMFIAFAYPREIWRHRATTVGIPLLLSCVVMVVLFFRTSDGEQQRLQQHFHEQAKLMAQSIKSRISLYSNSVLPLERLFIASVDVTAAEFAIFVDSILKNHPGIRAMSWNAKVSQQQRAEYEAGLLASTVGGLGITERDASGQLISAAIRSEYFPVTYIAPMPLHLNVTGYDVGSEALRLQALQTAGDQGTATLTAPLDLVQNQQQKNAMLLFYPVYTSAETPPVIAERRQLLRGFVVAALHMDEVIGSAVRDYPAQSFQLLLTDISDNTTSPQSELEPGTSSGMLFSKLTSPIPAYAKPLIWLEEFSVGGRKFRMEILPTEHYLQDQSTLQPWAVLTGGLLLCSLLGGFLLSVTGRAEQVQRLVQQRTLELSGILDNAAEAILIFDTLGQIERANAAAQQLFGYSERQLPKLHIGSLLPELQQTNPDFVQQRQGRSSETAGLTALGTALELEISLSSYALPGHTWFICLLHDISERKKIERLKSEFIATVSHELRTPLTSIKGSLELVNAGVLGHVPEAASNMLSLAQKNTERLVLLVNDILDIEKLELGDAHLELACADLRELLQQALTQNQGYAANFGVPLSLDVQALPLQVLVEVNNQRLQQVLSNLISNAVKFSEAGSPVQMSAELHEAQVLIKVSDQGPGIPNEFRSRIFQKFAQADGSDSRQRGGTGLGLSICKELMDRMHGTIGFDSVEGVGSTFYITLPLLPVAG